MRIDAVRSGISSGYSQPIWLTQKAPAVNANPTEDYYTPQVRTPYETTQKQENPSRHAIKVANFPRENMDLWEDIKKQYKIELVNTVEARFSREEMVIIDQTLGEVPLSHLIGVASIIKCFSPGLNMELMLTRANGRMILGAYQKVKKQMMIFRDCPLHELRRTVLHEIGHAVHSYCVTPAQILDIAKQAGWILKEFQPTFMAQNTFYPMILQEKQAQETTWTQAGMIFSENELRKKRTLDGRYELHAPDTKKTIPAYQNPLETFASWYEQK